MSGIVRPIRRASSRAGFAAPSTRGMTLLAPRRELLLRQHEVRVRAGREPHAEERDDNRRDERADRGTRQESLGARQVQRAGVGRELGERPAAARSRRAARRSATALDAMDSVSSVSPEYETANASVSGPTNAGVRICFSTVTGTGSSSLNAAATTSPEIPEPPMPSTTMLRIESPRGNRSACTRPAASCAAANCSGSPATASRNPRLSVVTARRWAGCPRLRPSWSAARPPRRRRSRSRR